MSAMLEGNPFHVSIASQRQMGHFPRLEELREKLRALPADAHPRERAGLHLAAALVMQDRQEGGTRSAIQEARQALELLSGEGGPALAAARFHLGRLVLILAVGDPALPPERATLAEARHLLEQARGDFEALGALEALALTAVELAFATEREGEVAAALDLLDDELARTPGSTRGLLRLWKATLGFGKTAHARDADAAVAAFLKEDARTDADEAQLCELLGMFHRQLSSGTRKLALAWLEARPDPPLHHLIVLRSTLFPEAPSTWIRAEERARLEAQLEDPRTPVQERWHLAHLFMCNLDDSERDFRLRCAEMLEEAILSPEVLPPQQTAYRNDTAAAYLTLARGDRRLVSRAVEHLTAVVDRVQAFERTDVMMNLASAHAALLEIDAALSTPTLLQHVRRIEDILGELPTRERGRARDPRMRAASALLRWQAFTHPECLREARRLLREILSFDATDGDALRFTHLAAWCAHLQGRGAAAAVEEARAAAERVGPVPEVQLMPVAGEPIERVAMLVRVLSGTEPPSRAERSSLAAVTRIRPDAVELLLAAAEEGARVGIADGRDAFQWLEILAHALQGSPAGDTQTRARRMAALVVSLALCVTGEQIAEIVSVLRGPIGLDLEVALRASGIAFGHRAAAESDSRPLEERVGLLQARALELFQTAQESRNAEKAIPLLEEARGLLDEAVLLARPLEPEKRATVQVSAGNARRHLAAAQPERARPLLDEAIALYEEALPWSRPDSKARAQASKVLAQALILRGVAADWPRSKQLFTEALEIRRTGQFRAETLMAVLDAELAHPSRSRLTSVAAALDVACEALEHVVPQMEPMRLEIGSRAVSLLAELVRGDALEPAEATRYSDRIATTSPKLVNHAKLAALGLAELQPRKRDLGMITSPFARALLESSELAREPLADHSAPPHLAEVLPRASAEDRRRRNDPAGLQREAERWRAKARECRGETRAGYLVGIARLVERRAELGDARLEELEAAFEEALASLPEIANLEVRAFALSDLATVWTGHHAARNFARAARHLEEALRLFKEAGSDAGVDTLQYLARATRYREDIPRAQAVKTAIVMYQDAASRYRARGSADGYMICLLNLAEALAMQDDRPRATAIKEAIAADHVAIEVARLRGDRPHLGLLLANVAWSLTLLAEDQHLPTEERERHWKEAGPLYEEALTLTEDPNRLASLRNNRLSWLEIGGAPQTVQIAERRRQLESIDRRAQPHS